MALATVGSVIESVFITLPLQNQEVTTACFFPHLFYPKCSCINKAGFAHNFSATATLLAGYIFITKEVAFCSEISIHTLKTILFFPFFPYISDFNGCRNIFKEIITDFLQLLKCMTAENESRSLASFNVCCTISDILISS